MTQCYPAILKHCTVFVVSDALFVIGAEGQDVTGHSADARRNTIEIGLRPLSLESPPLNIAGLPFHGTFVSPLHVALTGRVSVSNSEMAITGGKLTSATSGGRVALPEDTEAPSAILQINENVVHVAIVSFLSTCFRRYGGSSLCIE